MEDFHTLFTSYIDKCIEDKLIQKYFINKQNVNLIEIQNGYERIRQNLQEIGDIINEVYDNQLFNANGHFSKTTNSNNTGTLDIANHSYNQLTVPFLYSSSLSSSSSTSSSASSSSLSSVLSLANFRKDNILINDNIGTDYLDHVYINLTNLNSLNELSNYIIKVNDPVYVCDKDSLTSTAWKPAIVEFIGKDLDNIFYITKLNGHSVRLEASKIAFNSVPLPHLKIGTNVIARCKINSSLPTEDLPLIAGIVAEPPKGSNGYRYLVFFNSPLCTCNYVNLDEIHLIAQSNAKPWTDFDESTRGFIKHYISNYPERLMVKINPNEKIKIKIDQFWTLCRVLKVDSSIMKVASVVSDKYSEWIYRGSHRLWPIYHEVFHQVKESSSHNKNRAIRKIIDPRWFNKTTESQPFVQYLQESDSDLDLNSNSLLFKSKRNQIARKSTAKPSFESSIHNNHKLKEKNFKFTISTKPHILRVTKSFVYHKCCKQCIASTNQDFVKMKDQNPYTIPIMLGWQRQISLIKLQEEEFKTNDIRQVIFYVAPCGRRLRNLEEVDYFLEITKCLLTIDYFVFDVNFELCHPHHQDTISCYYYEADISKGRENMPISVVNTIDEDVIEENFCYRAKRFGGREVSIPLDNNFLVSCKCDNNCRDSSICDCRQLTVSSTQIIPGQFRDESAGYEHKRLKDFLITGIYECNSKCSCGPSCCNRVVQQGIKVRLQIFKTLRRGWGVRTLHDIPKGAFLTIYAAEILTDSIATQDGHLHGDEYLADLDYIDVCENLKENYEAAPQEEISSDEEEREESEPESSKDDDDKEYRVHRSKLGKSHLSNCWRKSPRIQSKQENKTSKPKDVFKSIREYYNECFSYTLDAKRAGNIGRYLNHSCSPNCFVQNVFVDTHDLRFPWVAFFAAKHIPAFSELTWDYNYEIGSVEGKKMLCYCMSLKCRGRLL